MSIYEMKWLVLVGLDQGNHIAEDMNGFNTRKEARVYAKELKESFSAMAKRDCENGKPPRRFDVKVVKNDGSWGSLEVSWQDVRDAILGANHT